MELIMKDYSENFDDEADFGKLSKINSAVIVNATINNLFMDFYRHYRHGEYLNANSDLDCIWTILGGEKGIENSETEEEYYIIEKKIADSGNLQNSIERKGFNSIDEKQKQKFVKQKKILLDKALFLTRLKNVQGKGTAYSMGEEDYMDV